MSDPSAAVADYSHGHHASVLASHGARTAANSCGYLLVRLSAGASVLDIGCGPGSITLDLAEIVGPAGRVVGVDFAADAVTAARAAAAARGDDRTRFVVGDILDLEEPTETFDVVHAHQVLQHLRDPVAALEAMARHCRPDGIIAVRDADYGAMSWFPASPGLDAWRTTYTAAARATGAEPDAGRRLRAWVQEAGLDLLDVGSSTWTYATPDTARWWGDGQADRVRHSNFATQAAAQGCTPQAIEEIALAWEQWGRSPEARFSIPHGEVIATPRRV